MQNPAFAPMMNYAHWVVYKTTQALPGTKSSKVPYNPRTGHKASTTDANTWATYAEASAALSNGYDGLGFVFSERDPFFLIDIDSCIDPDTNSIDAPEAAELYSKFSGAMVEVSLSGEGLHIIGCCDKAFLADKRNKWADGLFEFYTHGRFVAFGRGFTGNPWIDWTQLLSSVVPTRAPGDDENHPDIGKRRPEWRGPEDDDELVARMRAAGGSAQQRFGHKAPLKDLLDGNPHVLAAWFPHPDPTKLFDHSAADQALMNGLAYWTGCDYDRMSRIFGSLPLGARRKWQKRPYYRNRTVKGAAKNCTNVYSGNRAEKAENNTEVIEQLTIDEMLERFYFDMNAAYSSNSVELFDIKTLTAVNINSARTLFASSMTLVDEKQVSTFKIWESHPLRRYVNTKGWFPNKPKIFVNDADEKIGNIWRGINSSSGVAEFDNDITNRTSALALWFEHLAFIIEDEELRHKFTQFLAHIFQKPEQLPSTYWLLIADGRIEGLGRNWISAALAAILGNYVLEGARIELFTGEADFNSILSQRLLAVIDEIKADMMTTSRDGAKAYEQFKSSVIAQSRTINKKRQAEYVERNCCRLMLFSNHMDAIPLSDQDRRCNIVVTRKKPQSATYYTRLYGALKDQSFLDALHSYLRTYSLVGFDPGARAHQNFDKLAVIEANKSDLAYKIRDAAATIPGPICTIRKLRTILQTMFEVSCPNDGRLFTRTIREAGFEVLPNDARIKVNGRMESVVLIQPHIKPEMLWDLSSNSWVAGKQTMDYLSQFLD